MARGLLSSLPPPYRLLDPEDVKLVGEHPIAAGGFADIWEGTHDGRKVVLKSFRRHMSFGLAQVIAVRCDHSLHRAHY